MEKNWLKIERRVVSDLAVLHGSSKILLAVTVQNKCILVEGSRGKTGPSLALFFSKLKEDFSYSHSHLKYKSILAVPSTIQRHEGTCVYKTAF